MKDEVNQGRVDSIRLREWRRELIPQARRCIAKRAVGDL